MGAPAHFVGDSTRQNFVKFWKYGNHPTVRAHSSKIGKLVNKEKRNKHLMIFPLWLRRFIANLHLTPRSVVFIPGKNDRLVWYGSLRLSPESTPINDHTSLANDPPIHYGSCFARHLQQIWRLRLHRPTEDILFFDDDVKSCFRHAKLNLGIAPAFSFILQQYLCVPIGQVFGSNASPLN